MQVTFLPYMHKTHLPLVCKIQGEQTKKMGYWRWYLVSVGEINLEFPRK